MSRLGTLLRLVPRLPTVLRTLRHVRPAQALAQLRHMLVGLPEPARLTGPAPALALERPHTPFLAPPAHVGGDAQGVELLATRDGLGDSPDWDTEEHGPLFAYHLHQQEYLRLDSVTPDDRAKLLCDWIDRHPRGIGWDPHPISLRLLCWSRMLLTPGALPEDAALREKLTRSMIDQAETLDRGLEVRLQANHLLSNLLSLVFVGVLFEGDAGTRGRGRATRLIAELDAQILPDGGHEERSPMYHALLLENVLDLLNLCRAASDAAPSGLASVLESTAARMLDALEVLTHPDGRIALFADAGFGIAAETAALVDYAARLGVPREPTAKDSARLLPQTGYLRLAAGGFDLIASVAGPAPAHQPGHAHCDALSFELSVDGARVVQDTGLFEYRPGALRDLARTTASHATLMIDGQEQAEVWAAHRIGGRPEVALVAWDEEGTAEAHCRAWPRGAAVHHRSFSVDATGVEIIDRVEGDANEVVSRWPIAPDWNVELEEGVAWLRRASTVVRMQLSADYRWTVERADCYPTFGVRVERPVLVGRAAGPVTSRLRITRAEPDAST